jgi:hypothetical protein
MLDQLAVVVVHIVVLVIFAEVPVESGEEVAGDVDLDEEVDLAHQAVEHAEDGVLGVGVKTTANYKAAVLAKELDHNLNPLLVLAVDQLVDALVQQLNHSATELHVPRVLSQVLGQ